MEDDAAPSLPVKEVVKNKTSSKKSDVPPPSADPAKAKKKSKPTGNEGALKTKLDNKSVPAPSNTPSKHYKRPLDRHSRSKKVDTDKKVKQGWGSDDKKELVEETEALDDANAELEGEGDFAEDTQPKKSLTEYFAELELKQKELDSRKTVRAPNGAKDNFLDAEKIQKEQAEYVPATSTKKTKAKPAKEKKFLDFEASFADEKATPRPASRRGDFKGGNKGFNGRKKYTKSNDKPASAKPASAKPAVNDKNFPSL